jgi:hypothetical protein
MAEQKTHTKAKESMSLDDDKELMWGILTANPVTLAHQYGQELLALSKKRNQRKFHARADELLTLVMNNVADPVMVVAVAKCWLSHYHIPLTPSDLPSFDRFQHNYGSLVTHANARDIPVL